MVVKEEETLESITVTGVTSDRNEFKITVRSVPDEPGVVAQIFEQLAEQNISVDMIIQNVARQGATDLTFTVPKDDVVRAREIAERIAETLKAEEVVVDGGIVKVSIIGLGMRSHAGVAAKMFRLLAEEGINVEAISTSEIKISCLIREKYAELAVRTLHDGFQLGSSG